MVRPIAFNSALCEDSHRRIHRSAGDGTHELGDVRDVVEKARLWISGTRCGGCIPTDGLRCRTNNKVWKVRGV